jgi:4-amino-4-deoxy-L-arabinose transferase-like glycosyltransferase
MSRELKLNLSLAIVALSVFISPFGRDLFVGDETKYGQVIREMRATHSFFVPILGGTPFTHKPPLHFWLVDLLSFLLDPYSTWTFVLPSIAALVGMIFVMRSIGKELFDGEAGLVAAFVATSSLLIWASGQSARMDVSFTLFTTLGCWLLYRFFNREDFRALSLSALFVGIAALIKGPMSAVIWIALFAIEAVRRRRAPRGNYLVPLAIAFAVPMLWVVPAIVIGGPSFANAILYKQTVGRAVSAWVHKAPPWYYFAHAPATFFPWFFVFVVAVVGLKGLRAGERGLRADEQGLRAQGRGPREEKPGRPQLASSAVPSALSPEPSALPFCLSWIAAVLLPYSLMSSKLDVYMMAAVPPMALLIGAFVSGRRDSDGRATHWAFVFNVLTIAFLGVAGIVGLARGATLIKGPEAAMLSEAMTRVWLGSMTAIALAFIAWLVIASKERLLDSTLAAGLMVVLSFSLLAALLMPRVNDIASTRPLIAALIRQQVPGEQIVLYSCPHLWSRDFPRQLEKVSYVGDDVRGPDPTLTPEIVATARGHASEIASFLRNYRKVDEVRMIGKWFDVYRRRH